MRSASKIGVIVAVCALLLSGCTRSSTGPVTTSGGKYGSGVDLNFDKNKPMQEQTQARAQQATSSGGNARVQQYGGTAGGAAVFHPNITKKPLDNGTTGGNAYWYLNAKTPGLDIEIDAVKGMAPSQATINMLNQRLHAVADKPAGIRFLPPETIPESKSKWNNKDITTVEEKHRSSHNSLDRASIYLLFVDGEPEQQGPIGVAYSSSADVIFEQTIRGAATPLVSAQAIEQATVIHEIGHLLSLVNLTYRSPRDHEDPNHPGHSKNQASVMYWAIDNVGVATLLGGHTEPPNTYDADDLADLRDVKAGKLGPH